MSNPDNHGPFRPAVRPSDADDGGARSEMGADQEWAEYVAWLDREATAGREPEPWPLDEAEPWDLASWDLAPANSTAAGAVPAGPTTPVPTSSGPAGDDPAPRLFARDGAGDVLPPDPFLAALTEQAVSDVAALSDNELVGVLRASRRQVAHEHYKQALAAAEFGRRRQAAFNSAMARGVPAGCAAGGFPGEELAIELTVSRADAGHLIDDGTDLTSRLPRTLAGMAAGLIDADKAGWIAYYTRILSPADAALADEFLAGEAPDLQADQLARKAAALEKRLNPEGARARRERSKRDDQRIVARREASGNASLAGRELDVADVLASKAYLDALASRLRASGVSGTLDRLRALAFTDVTQGRDPLDRVSVQPAPPAGSGYGQPPAPPSGPTAATPDATPSGLSPVGPPEDLERAGDGTRNTGRPGGPAPVPALVNLIIPAGTLLGWSAAPAQAGSWGLLDGDETRAVATAAGAHPQSRWCATLTGPDGTALAHGCARGPRPHLLDQLGPQPPPAHGAQTAQADQASQLSELLRRLGLAFTPIARASHDPAPAEGGYVPSRALKHLVRARNATCDAPGCHNPAVTADLDHTVPWPDGPTSQANLAARCRTHHRAKQAPDWTVEQLAPGVSRWTLPSGRTHVTTPTRYDT